MSQTLRTTPDICVCGHTAGEHVRNDDIVARCIPYQSGIGSCPCSGYSAALPDPPPAVTVWKYEVPPDELFEVAMPAGAQVLTVQTQPVHGRSPWTGGLAVVMWALVDPDAPPMPRHFLLVGTGQPASPAVPDTERRYVGTFQVSGGALVVHLFEQTYKAHL